MSLKTILKFAAPWCGPCRAFAPVFKELSSKYSQFTFQEVNCDENPEAVKRFNVNAIPQVVFLDENESEINRIIAPLDKNKLEAELKKYL